MEAEQEKQAREQERQQQQIALLEKDKEAITEVRKKIKEMKQQVCTVETCYSMREIEKMDKETMKRMQLE